jgi:hypothetical protein
MDQTEAVNNAREFVDRVFRVESLKIFRLSQRHLAESRNQAAARGSVLSGGTVLETARNEGAKITALLQSRLDGWLEGIDLHGAVLDDKLVDVLQRDLGIMRSDLVAAAEREYSSDPLNLARLIPAAGYSKLLGEEVGLSSDEIRTQIDRRRLMPKKTEGPSITTIYNVQGDNARWNTNSTDNSVNVVTKSSEEFFADLRGRIESEVPDGDERRKILESLTTLRASHGRPSFAQRYTDFMAAAANHIKVIAPFIPALTEMLHHVLK